MRMPLGRASAATILGALLALALSGGAGGAAVAAGPSSPWSQTDYNAAQSRANLTEQTLTATTVGRVRYLRGIASPPTPPSQEGCNRNIIVAPVLTGGRLYAVTNGRLAKYNPATGALIWRRLLLIPNTKGSFSLNARSLAVAGGLVVVGSLDCLSESEPDGFISAFNASTGGRVWSQPITPDLRGALDQMVVSGSYVATAGTSEAIGPVLSVHKLTTGALVWSRFSGGCRDTVLVVAGLVISNECPDTGLTVTARNLATGALAWRKTGNWGPLRGDADGTAGRHLFAINPSGAVVSLDPLTGTPQFSLANAADVLAADATRAYGNCGSLGVCAYSTTTGARLWSTQPASPPVLAAEAGGVLYLDQGNGLGQGNALNAATGKSITDLWDGTASALAVGDGRIAVVTDPRVLDLYGLPGS
jgi:outer membrane protein assembly factor BamB